MSKECEPAGLREEGLSSRTASLLPPVEGGAIDVQSAQLLALLL